MQRIKNLIYFILHSNKWLNGPSYFSEKKQTNKIGLFIYQICHIIKYKGPNDFYWLYGFDVKNKKERSLYVPYLKFRDQRNKMNNYGIFSSILLLRNKDLFCAVAKYYEIPVLSNVGVYKRGNVYQSNGTALAISETLKKHSDVFIKAIDSECGQNIYHIIYNDDEIVCNGGKINMNELKNILGENEYVIQDKLKQHPDLNRLHPNSVNTIRIVTVRSKDDIVPFSAELRIGTGDSCIDNLAAGGVAVGINEYGELNSFGIQKPPHGMITYSHPDTNIVYKGYPIPYFKDVITLTKRFHSILPNIHSIGWDVAISECGPIIVEGNDNWEISGLQACNGGLKESFNKYFIQ